MASDQNDRIGFLLYRVGRDVSVSYKKSLKPIGARAEEIGILHALLSFGPSHVRQLSRQLGINRQTIVNDLDNLKRRRLVKVEVDPDDHRINRAEITALGNAYFKKADDISSVMNSKIESILSEKEKEAVYTALRKILAANI